MDQDTRSLARQLFARATMILEEAHEVSVTGQSPRLTVDGGTQQALELRRIAREVSALGEAIEAVISSRIPGRGR
tara:strand:- start:213 stop:437 length:225 start_codon:yes stop_codon:yes gene_type:complete